MATTTARPPLKSLDDALAQLLGAVEPLPGQEMVSTLNADGRVLKTEIAKSSGNPALDQRAEAIAGSAGPFGRFSEAMQRKADQILVVSRFRFTRDETLETSLTSQ